MPITRLLTRTDGSAGRQKTDARPIVNLLKQIAAVEWNNLADAVVELLSTLGRSDGSDPGTLFRTMVSFAGPRETRAALFEDFATAVDSQFVTTVAGGGTLTFTSLGSAGDGFGLAKLTAPAAGGALVEARTTIDCVRRDQAPDHRFRFKTPAAFAGADFWVGFRNAAGTTYARMRCNGSSTVVMQTGSTTGGGTASSTSGTDLAVSTWYEGRIVVSELTVSFYIDDSLIGAIYAPSSAIPVAADSWGIWAARCERSSAGPHDLYIDWYELRATRL